MYGNGGPQYNSVPSQEPDPSKSGGYFKNEMPAEDARAEVDTTSPHQGRRPQEMQA